jgi:hypothetical protein
MLEVLPKGGVHFVKRLLSFVITKVPNRSPAGKLKGNVGKLALTKLVTSTTRFTCPLSSTHWSQNHGSVYWIVIGTKVQLAIV